MLNLSCVICAELFATTDEVHSTTCGHMFHNHCLRQWMDRSKTCPQCRHRCTDRNVFRIYFNLANLDASRIDVATLQEQLENANLQLKLKENELKKFNEELNNMKESQKKWMKTIKGLEAQLEKLKFTVDSYSVQLKIEKAHSKITDNLRDENKNLKEKIESMKSVSIILSASTADADAMLKNEKDPKTLCILATTLKRELRLCQTKKTELHSNLKRAQNELRKKYEEISSLEERIAQLESENYQLNEKWKIKSPVIKSTSTGEEDKQKALNDHVAKVSISEGAATISPTIKESVKNIEESDSPYLNIKSSSVGLVPLFNRKLEPKKYTNFKNGISPIKNTVLPGATNMFPKNGILRKTTSDLSEKYSIFKKPRLALSTLHSKQTMKPLASNMVYNGVGGTERLDPFAQNSNDEREVAKTEQARAKKLRPKRGDLFELKSSPKKLQAFTTIEID